MSYHDIITVYHIIISFYHYVYIHIYISLSIPTFLAAMVASLPWIVWISLQFWLSLLSFQHRVHCWLEHGLVWPKCEKPSCHMMQDTRRNVFWWNLMNFSISLWISWEMRIVHLAQRHLMITLMPRTPKNPCQHRLKRLAKPMRLIKNVFSQASPKLPRLAWCTFGRGHNASQRYPNFDATPCNRHNQLGAIVMYDQSRE